MAFGAIIQLELSEDVKQFEITSQTMDERLNVSKSSKVLVVGSTVHTPCIIYLQQ